MFNKRKKIIFGGIIIISIIVIFIAYNKKAEVIVQETVSTTDKVISNDTEIETQIVQNTEEETEETIKTEETIEEVVIEVTLDEKIEEQLDSMTLEEKVGQMFIVAPETFTYSQDVIDISHINKDKALKYNVGGFIHFAKNISNPEQIIKLNHDLYNLFDKNKPFIAVDEEGGQVARISNNQNFPDKRIENMNEVQDANRAFEIGDTIGAYLRKYGFNLDFAPVADVLVESKNVVVAKRSFSSSADIVSEMSLNVHSGLQRNNIFAATKHFPGHGSTVLDTHNGFAISNSTIDEMNEVELLPFKNLINNDIEMVMISHVIYPHISSNNMPATLNYDIVTSLLKDELNFNGIVITDAMNMGAIANNFTVTESTIMAVEAGIDIILMPSNFYTAYDAIINAVRSDRISEERIDESVIKILKLKESL